MHNRLPATILAPSASASGAPTPPWRPPCPFPPTTCANWPPITCGASSPVSPPTAARPPAPSWSEARAATSGTPRARRYLDGLAGLFTVQVGHGRRDHRRGGGGAGREAGLLPAVDLHPPDRHRAGGPTGRPGARRPEPGVLHHRRRRGGRVGVEAGPPVLQGHAANPTGTRRSPATSPTTAPPWGPWPSPASPTIREPFEPLTPGAHPRREHQPLPLHVLRRRRTGCTLQCADDIERAILREGPETVAAVFLEPVQNAGGCFTPPPRLLRAGARDLRSPRRAARVRRGHLRLRSARRAGSAAERVGYQPDMITWPRASPRATRRWAG